MKFSASVFLMALLCFSCSSSDSEPDKTSVAPIDETATKEETEEENTPTEETKPYYYENASIAFETNSSGNETSEIKEGTNLVFYYYKFYNPYSDPSIADDEYTEELIFKISQDATSFRIEKEDFPDALAKFRLGSNQPESGFHEVTDGFIEGTKISETEWTINLNIIWTVPANEDHDEINYEFELSSNFIPEPQE